MQATMQSVPGSEEFALLADEFRPELLLTATPGVFTLRPATANGQPAVAIYRRTEDGTRRAYGIQVLTLRESCVVGVVAFLDPGLFPVFGLTPGLPAQELPEYVNEAIDKHAAEHGTTPDGYLFRGRKYKLGTVSGSGHPGRGSSTHHAASTTASAR